MSTIMGGLCCGLLCFLFCGVWFSWDKGGHVRVRCYATSARSAVPLKRFVRTWSCLANWTIHEEKSAYACSRAARSTHVPTHHGTGYGVISSNVRKGFLNTWGQIISYRTFLQEKQLANRHLRLQDARNPTKYSSTVCTVCTIIAACTAN